MIRKRVKAGLLSAALAVSVLLTGGNALQVNAEVAGTNTASSGVGDAIKISKNDLSVTSNRVGVCEIISPEAWRAPTNSSYYVSNLWGDTSWSGDYRKPSDEEWEAFRSAVTAGQYTNDVCSLTNGSDDTLTYTSAAGWCIGASQYLSSELTVVDGNTTTKLPGIFNTGSVDCPTYYYLCARKANDDWDVLFEYDYNEQDRSFSWSDYLKDDYVYFLLYSSEALTDANTTVYRMFTTADKLDAVRQKLPEWTISAISDGSEGMVDNGNGTFTVKDNDLGSTVINAAVVSEGMVYRMYNPNTGEHFYTKDASERDSLKESGWNYEENASFETIAADEAGATPVYRVYNPNSGLHHYTMNKGEALSLKSLGWNYEGISLYVYGKDSGLGTPEYRLYNENDGQHHWTVDAAERDYLVSIGWNDEGIAWNVK